MLVTIFADAAYDHEKRLAGWGGWVKSSRASRFTGGPLRPFVESVNEAELKAACRAVFFAIVSSTAESGDHLLVQCDNLRALAFLKGKVPKRSTPLTGELSAQQWLRAFLFKHNLTLTTRHVKGHSAITEPRYYCNHEVDRLAKQGLNEARALFRKGGKQLTLV